MDLEDGARPQLISPPAGVLVDVITAINMLFRNHIPIQMELQMMGKQKVSARLKCVVLILPAAASIAYVAG